MGPERPKMDSQRVGELMQRITGQKIMIKRFRFNLSVEEAFNLLAAHYGWVVQYRHERPVFDQYTQDNLFELAQFLTQRNPKFGVMFCGPCGNGKTTMLYTLQSAINDLHKQGHFDFLDREFRVSMQIVDAKDIVNIAKDWKAANNLRQRDMLAIDDLGKEPTEVLDYGNVLGPVIDLLEYRYQQQLFTAVTTNLTSVEIRDKYRSRIADRFNEMMQVIIFRGESYRR